MERICTSCGHKNDYGANFCSSCGERIRGGPDATTEAMSVIDEISNTEESVERSHLADREGFDENIGLLVVDEGPKGGSRYALDSALVSAGRHPESDIFLDDVTVSRRHAVIERIEDHYQVRDAGSLNGTYLNRERVDDAILTDGDEVQVGKFKLVFVAPAQTGRSTPVAKEDD